MEMGSSPRVRGTSLTELLYERAEGLIPAGAGNMSYRRYMSISVRAHPRGCGEHSGVPSRDIGMRGSSPRVRGTLT